LDACPFVTCRFHLAVADVRALGHLTWHIVLGRDAESLSDDDLAARLRKLPYGGCSLEAAKQLNLAEIAEVLGVSRQRADQLESSGMNKIRRRMLA
jgi:hypothetical protein